MKKIIFALIVCSFCLANSASAQEESVVRIESSDGTSTEYEVDQLLRVELMGDSIRFIASDGSVAAEVYKYDYVRLIVDKHGEQAIESTPFHSNKGLGEAYKILQNGQVYILWGEKLYTLQGQEVK